MIKLNSFYYNITVSKHYTLDIADIYYNYIENQLGFVPFVKKELNLIRYI